MANGQTVEEVVAEAQALQHDLLTARHEVRSAFDKIKTDASAARRVLTEAERDLRTALRAARSELGEALRDLNWVTLERLNAASDVKLLHDKLLEINDELGDDIKRLKKLEAVAATAAKVADTIAKVAAKTVTLAAKL